MDLELILQEVSGPNLLMHTQLLTFECHLKIQLPGAVLVDEIKFYNPHPSQSSKIRP